MITSVNEQEVDLPLLGKTLESLDQALEIAPVGAIVLLLEMARQPTVRVRLQKSHQQTRSLR